MNATLATHRPWVESVLACPLTDAMILETEFPFGDLIVEDLLPGNPLNAQSRFAAKILREQLDRWSLPPDVTPRVALRPTVDNLHGQSRYTWAGGTFEITRWVLGWGDAAEVMAPPSLRDHLRATLAAALTN
jgi:hypothetical protein